MTLHFRQIQHLLPRSKAWALPYGSTIRGFFEGIANGLLQPARDFIDGVWEQIFPETTDEITEWEQELGCWGSGTEAQRRLSLAAEWQATGGQSPRYLQDILQAAGFDVYYHGWSDGIGGVRDPHDYTETAHSGTEQCHGTVDAFQDQCADVDTDDPPRCDFFLANEVNYIVNESLNRLAPPPLPDDADLYRFFIYFGGETFGTLAPVPVERLIELKRLMLKISPANMWIVTLFDVDPTITITPPASTEYVVGCAAQLAGGSERLVGGQVEASFTPTFTDIVGTSGVIGVGGAWSLNVTALIGDIGSLILYVREVGGTTARATLACTVVVQWDALIAASGGTNRVTYDINDAGHVTVVAGLITAATPVTGGGANDALAPFDAGAQPTYNASDAAFGGHASAESISLDNLRTSSGATAHAQPHFRIIVGVPPIGATKCWFSGRDNTNRQELWVNHATLNPYGILAPNFAYDTDNLIEDGICADHTQGAMVICYFAGASSWFEVRRADGGVQRSRLVNPGANSVSGVSLLTHWAGGSAGPCKVTAFADVDGLNEAGIQIIHGFAKALWGTDDHNRTYHVCAGNSLSIGYQPVLSSINHAWDTEVTRGGSGVQTPTLTADIANHVDQYDSHPHGKNVIILWEAGNHIALGGATAQQAYDAYVAYVAAARGAGWTSPKYIVVTTIGPRVDLNEVTRGAFNTLLRAGWAGMGADALTDFAENPALNPPAAGDGIHYSVPQYGIIAAAFKATVDGLAFP